MATLATHLRSMNLAEMFPPTRELAQTYSEHGPGMSLVPWFSRAVRYAERSLAMREGLGDLWGKAQTLHFHGIVLYAASQYTECVGKCREAIRLFDQTGDFWELNMAALPSRCEPVPLGGLGRST